MAFAVQRQLPARQDVVDPFEPYIHFPAKLYSSGMGDALEIVEVDWIMCHFARWQMSSEHVVVLSLSRVCIHPFAFSFYHVYLVHVVLSDKYHDDLVQSLCTTLMSGSIVYMCI